MKIQGKYNCAEIFNDSVEEKCMQQIYNLLNIPVFADSQISIMPDVHLGKGVVIGFTMQLNDFICPSVVGCDIGCGVLGFNLGKIEVDLKEFDSFVRGQIPSGKMVREKIEEKHLISIKKHLLPLIEKIDSKKEERFLKSIGTLGGGNHFIELNKDMEGNLWLVSHTGSRSLGLAVYNYYSRKSKKYVKEKFKGAGAYYGMEFLPMNGGGQEYLEDMHTAQEYAALNRFVISQILIEGFFKIRLNKCESIESVHNYINLNDRIIRKGAIAAHKGQKVIIPLNMRDGTAIGTGKGNPRWNYSACHGSGRRLSRIQAKKEISLNEFHQCMHGIYSTSIGIKTIDESPMAYKPSNEILTLVKEAVDIQHIMKPIYNFKDSQ